MKVRVSSVFVIALAIYMCMNMWYRVLHIGMSPNVLAGILIILSLIAIYIFECSKTDFLIIMYLVITAGYTMLVSKDLAVNREHIINFSVACLILNKLTDPSFRIKLCDLITEKAVLLKRMCLIAVLGIVVSYFDPSSFSYGFTGFSQGAHSFLSGLIIIFTLYMCVTINDPISIRNLIIPAIVVVAVGMGAARSYLVSILVLVIVYYFLKVERTQAKVLVFICALFSTRFIFHSNIFERFTIATNQAALSNQGQLDALTSGRTMFWVLDIQAFFSKNIFEQLFGSGFDYLYTYNLEHYGLRIWAHNDFIHLINSVGIVGLIVYCVILYRLIVSIRNTCKNYYGRIKYPTGLLFIFVVGLALINGFYTYQQYIYSTVFFALLITYDRELRNADT